MLFDEDDVTKRWVEYVSELYDDERGEPPELVNVEGLDILPIEVETTIKDLKYGKAGGTDNITVEMPKTLDETGIEKFTNICNYIYNSSLIPTDLTESIIVKLPKKARAMECKDHRTLSLMSHAIKVILKIIVKRNKKAIDDEISEIQSGFITGKGTREGIYNL